MQTARTGSIEQVLRCLAALALSDAFATEMQTVIGNMGEGAFQPGGLVDANGERFSLNLQDDTYGDPATWVPARFRKVLVTQQLKPVPPYPTLTLISAPGRNQPGMRSGSAMAADSGEEAGWIYVINAVVVASNARPDVATRSALALSQGLERLIRRNYYLGGLVENITADGPPAPGGEVESRREGLVAGVLQRYLVYVQTTIV